MDSAPVWSLWDMAEIFDAELLEVVQRMKTIGQGFLTLRQTQQGTNVPSGARFRQRDLDDHEALVRRFIELAGKVPLLLSIEVAEQFAPAINRPPYPYQRNGEWFILGGAELEILERGLSSVADTAMLELKDKTLIAISSKHRDHYVAPVREFGEAILEAFPVEYDLEEASKCLALGRFTASVFHLMRAAEAAAAVVSEAVGGDTHNDKGEPLTFGGLFVQVDRKINEMPHGPKKDAWLKLRGFMVSLNRGDRTKVAHPGTEYSERQAERIFGNTKSFLEEAEELL